jgi:hypothetical protein
MRQRLRKISKKSSGPMVNLLGVQADIIGVL